MRLSQFHLRTTKETPNDAELVSHQLMLRAGMIRKLASGLYTWSPLGLRVLRKVEAIVREEMNRAGAIELLMPTIQPRELWEESGRWAKFGPQLLKIKDRKEQEFCYAPTAEEVITDFARNELSSYKQLPVNFYQIQTKFRDEIRPRFGVMRSREFLMKDAYSFHLHAADLVREYRNMHAGLLRASSPGWGWSSARCWPTPAPSAAMPRRNSTCWPAPARTRWPSPPPRITRPTSRPPSRPSPRRARRPAKPCAASRRPRRRPARRWPRCWASRCSARSSRSPP